jgi:hypothetical protein
MDYTKQAQPWAPMERKQNKLLPAKPNHPFYYKWHPSNWQFQYLDVPKGGKSKGTEKQGFFIPHIRMERIVPGVNGIHQIKGEMGNPSSRIGKLQQDGWTYLDPTRYDYMSVYPVRGGLYHVPKWLEVKVIAGRLVTKMDTTAKNLWSIGLMLNKILPEPEPHFWELMILDYQKRPQKYLSSQHIPEIKKRIESDYKIIDDMKKALADFNSNGLEAYSILLQEK